MPYSWTLPAGLSGGGCLRGHSEVQPPSPPAAVALIHYGTAVSGTGQRVSEGTVLETPVCAKKVLKSTVQNSPSKQGKTMAISAYPAQLLLHTG